MNPAGIPTVTVVNRPEQVIVEIRCPHNNAGAKACEHLHADEVFSIALLTALGGSVCACAYSLTRFRRAW